jgi:hypothetical protein
MRVLTGFIVFAAVAIPAYAQHSPSDAESADTIRPKTFTVPGASQQVAARFAAQMMLAQREEDFCREFGCLVIINETANFNVTGFFVDMPGRDGTRRWGPNQFGEQLYPLRATYRFKTGDETACARPVLFVLRHKETKEVFKIETHASLCKSPQMDSVVRIRMVKPQVTVGED